MKIAAAIQVAHNLTDPETKEREISGLLEATNTYELKSGTIVALDEEKRRKNRLF